MFSEITNDGTNVYCTYMATGPIPGATSKGGTDIIVFKLNGLNGTTLWAKQDEQLNTASDDFQPHIIYSKGHTYVTYNTDSSINGESSSGEYDIVIFCLDTNGNIIWIKQPAEANSINLESFGRLATTDKFLYVVYGTEGDVGDGANPEKPRGDIVLVKMDFLGNIVETIQNRDFNTSSLDAFPHITVCGGNIYISFFTEGITSGLNNTLAGRDIVMSKFNDPSILPVTRAPFIVAVLVSLYLWSTALI
jgi:hypothetical protein